MPGGESQCEGPGLAEGAPVRVERWGAHVARRVGPSGDTVTQCVGGQRVINVVRSRTSVCGGDFTASVNIVNIFGTSAFGPGDPYVALRSRLQVGLEATAQAAGCTR